MTEAVIAQNRCNNVTACMLTQHRGLMSSTFPGGRAVLSSLFDCLRAAHADDSVRAIVLTGAGTNFSAGADIKGFAAGAPLDGSVNEKFNSLVEAGPKPTVAGEILRESCCRLRTCCVCRYSMKTPPKRRRWTVASMKTATAS